MIFDDDFFPDFSFVVLKDLKLIAEWLANSRWIEANEKRLKFNNKQNSLSAG